MNRKRISEALNGIQMEYIVECESYDPKLRKLSSEKEHKMERYEHKSRNSNRKIIALILAACLIMGLGITAYATGVIQSLIAKWANSFVIETPTDELREERPDYAHWLDEQLEMKSMMEKIGENAEKRDETASAEAISSAITLLESYYDGEKISMACKLTAPIIPADYHFDETHPMFSSLRTAGDVEGNQIWNAPTQEDYDRAQKEYRENGKVGFITREIFVSDHVYVNDEDCGPCHSDVDEDGYFVVKPFVNDLGDVVLSEACQNQPSVDVTLTIRKIAIFHWYENGKYMYCTGEIEDFPVTFTLENANYQGSNNG